MAFYISKVKQINEQKVDIVLGLIYDNSIRFKLPLSTDELMNIYNRKIKKEEKKNEKGL